MREKKFRVRYHSPIDPAYTLYVYTDTRKEARLVLEALRDYNNGLYEDGFKAIGKDDSGVEAL